MMDDLIEALTDILDAQRDLGEKLKTCEMDADYFLHDEYARVDKAKEQFATVLNQLIDSKINDRFGNR